MRLRKAAHRRKLFSYALGSAACGLAGFGAGQARGEMAEEALQLATDGDAGHLFLLNPAHLRPNGVQTGALLMENLRTSVLDHKDSGGATITSQAKDDVEAAGVLLDLGAGAGLELSHTIDFHSVTTSLDGQRSANDKVDLDEIQHTQARIVIELTDQIKAAIDIRYLHENVTVYGDPFVGQDETTHYVESLAGYGAGFAYDTKDGGLGWTLFPPLRGSSEVVGQQLIVIEPGLVSVDGWIRPKPSFVIGFTGTEYFRDIDDLAAGSTASDNQTPISLYGLDPDQYLVPKQQLLLGGDYALSKSATARVSLGEETDGLDFTDYRQYGAVGVNQQGALKTTTERLRAALRFVNQGVQVDLGGGYYQRQLKIPANMNGGIYKASGTALFATACLKI